DAVNVHRTGAADALAAGAAKRKGCIDGRFDLDQRIEHHRAAAAEVELEGIEPRPLRCIRIEPVDAKAPRGARARRSPVHASVTVDARIARQKKLRHGYASGFGLQTSSTRHRPATRSLI